MVSIEIKLIKLLIIIYLYLYFCHYVDALQGTCNHCIHFQYSYSKPHRCTFYKKPCIDAIKNCSHYDIGFRFIKKGL
jgi:hypothetical protein